MAAGYDYVIVGAGSAGCALANRLSEDGTATVLLLEAGGSDRHPYIQIPIGIGKLQQRKMFDWGFFSEPEPHLNNRRLEVVRGKVLGGSSSVNVMVYTRGDRGDFDRWASMGATGWSFADMLPYFKRSEAWEEGETPWRGGTGPLGTQWGRARDPAIDAWLEAVREAGLPMIHDMNSPDTTGFGRTQFTIRGGRRASAANAWLRPAVRPNLTVRTGVTVAGITMRGTRAAGVRLLDNGAVDEIEASRETILCGGVFGSPKLLMLSGIGPAEALRAHGIAPLIDLPVGRNLQDHLSVPLTWKRRDLGPFQRMLRLDRVALAMARAIVTRDGPATAIPLEALGFVKSRPDLTAPDLEFIIAGARPQDARPWFPGLGAPPTDSLVIRSVLLHPKSRGAVTLRSADPTAPVRISFNFLSEPEDLATLREGCRIGMDIATRTPLDALRGERIAPEPGVESDDAIDSWIRSAAITVNHPSSTCPMGTGDDAVLNPDLTVLGTEGLRVVDASAFPDMLSAHINAAVMAVADRASDLIRGKAPLAPSNI